MAPEMDAATVTTILSNINNLYGNLVSYTVGLVLFVGAFVPAVISFFQRRQFTREYDELSKQMRTEMRDELRKVEDGLRASIAEVQKIEIEKLQESNNNLKSELLKEIGLIRGASFHLQANQNRERPVISLMSSKAALSLYLEGNDERNARAVLIIVNGALQKTNKVYLARNEEIEEYVTAILHDLTEHNTNGRYALDIDMIRRELKSAKDRDTPDAT